MAQRKNRMTSILSEADETVQGETDAKFHFETSKTDCLMSSGGALRTG